MQWPFCKRPNYVFNYLMMVKMITIDNITDALKAYKKFLGINILLSKNETILRDILQSYLNKKEYEFSGIMNWKSEYKYKEVVDLNNKKKPRKYLCDLVKNDAIAIELKLRYSFEFQEKYFDFLKNDIIKKDLLKLEKNNVFGKEEEKYILLFIIHFDPIQLVGKPENYFKYLKYITGKSNIFNGFEYFSYMKDMNKLEIDCCKYINTGEYPPVMVDKSYLFEISNDKNIILEKINNIVKKEANFNHINDHGKDAICLKFPGEIDLNYNLLFFLYRIYPSILE